MSWFARLLDDTKNLFGDREGNRQPKKSYYGRAKSTTKASTYKGSSSRRNNSKKGQRKTGTASNSAYRAVSIHAQARGCEASHRVKGNRFLAHLAPQLPLGGCSDPQQCGCRYRYHEDRRVSLRRDSDHGLPSASRHGAERRYRRDRRTAA